MRRVRVLPRWQVWWWRALDAFDVLRGRLDAENGRWWGFPHGLRVDLWMTASGDERQRTLLDSAVVKSAAANAMEVRADLGDGRRVVAWVWFGDEEEA